MKNLDNWILVIIALAGILSPSITSLINNRHNLKMKELELKYDERYNQKLYIKKIFESYIKNTGTLIQNTTANNFSKYGETYGLALLYANKELKKSMIELNSLISVVDTSLANDKFGPIIEEIRKQLDKL